MIIALAVVVYIVFGLLVAKVADIYFGLDFAGVSMIMLMWPVLLSSAGVLILLGTIYWLCFLRKEESLSNFLSFY